MYRMMIVDDLPIIVDRLVRLFGENDRLELELFKAYSAFEAIDILKEIKMDIVLTDIKMPGMEGIELLHEIRKYWPKCKVVLLTSYDEFHYVKSAISGGGFDFILKFERDEVIVHSIEKAIAALDEEYATLRLLHQAQMQKKQVIPLLQVQFLSHWLSGKSAMPVDMMREKFIETGIQLHCEMPVFLLIGKIDDWLGTSGSADRSLLLYAVQNITTELLDEFVVLVSVTLEESKIVCLIQPKECLLAKEQEELSQEIWQRTFSFVFGSLELIQQSFREFYKRTISFVFSDAPVVWNQLSESYDYLRSLFLSHSDVDQELRLTNRTSTEVSRSTPASTVAKPNELSFRIKKIELLGRFLENGNKIEFDRLYEEIMNDSAKQTTSGFMKLEVYHALASVFLSYLRAHPLNPKLFAKVELEKLTHVNPNLSWDEIRDYFASLSAHIFEYKGETKELGKDNHILRLHEYIATNIAADLSLPRLAEVVHLNPGYLSRLYIQTTGTSISDYINLSRLDEAKRLLNTTSFKIYEIAQMVGYDSALSFIRFFKKQMDMTPQEYREL